MKRLFASAQVLIDLQEESPVTLELHWQDFVNSRQFREVLLEMLRLVRLHNAKRLLVDNTHIRALRPVDLDWSAAEIVPALSQAGVTRMAVVESRDAMNRLGTNAMLATAIPHTSIVTRNFPALTEARAWAMARV